MSEVLTRLTAMPVSTAPDGKKYGVFRLEEGALWDVRQVRVDEEDREVPDLRAHIPDAFKTKFTSDGRARNAIRVYLDHRWNENEEVVARNIRRNGKGPRPAVVEATASLDVLSAASQG